MAGHVAAGADAVLVSSAYAGGGLISTRHYREFVLPVEARVVSGFKARCPGTPVYTHTCGRIGDRLELLEETGTDGIDTLDPPPLGDVDLAEAKERVGGRLFLKGNVDPVATVLLGTPGRRARGRPPAHRDRRAGRRLRALDRLLGAPGRAARERDGAPRRRRRGRLTATPPGEG